ncbi:MAG: hypothetical protein SVX38_15490, partial [Chloroflexota bacterium]|nr:hypothetical protein [Chloroflexota bacterium]
EKMFSTKNHRFLTAIIALLVVSAAGCTSIGEPISTPQSPQALPTDTPPMVKDDKDVIFGEAQVENIEILILESFPVQINVGATGNLPDGCTTIDQIVQRREGNDFLVTITTVRPADAMCTEALVPFEEVISLDVYGLPAGTYTVDVNGVTDTFSLDVDNVPQES